MDAKSKKFKFKPIPSMPVSSPQISPDGQRILFTNTTLNEEDDKYESHVWIVPSKGGKPRQFTYGKGGDSNPRWSPDGKNILFQSGRGKTEDTKEKKERKTDLYLISAEGGEARLLASVTGSVEGAPSWSLDGKNLLYLSRTKVEDEGEKKQKKGEKEKESDIRVIKKLNHKLDDVGFFPDTRIHLFTLSVDSGKHKQLTKGEYDVASPDWSPDGKEIAFIANMTEDADFTPLRDIYMIPSKGGDPKKVVEGTSRAASLKWSPDGKYLAYASSDPIDINNQKHKFSKLWVVPSQGGEAINLTETFDRPVTGAVWSPDSKALYFRAPDYGTYNLYKVKLENSEVEQVTKGLMTVQSFNLSKDGSTIAFGATDATHLPEVWVHDAEGDRQITTMCEGLVKDMTLVEPEEFRFKASDGAEVQGWIMKPADFKKGKKYPTILNIHGGPWDDYAYGFYYRFQSFCNNGYAIVFMNHRASTGYGQAFADITGRWGDREYLDLMEGMDYVTEKYPFVDANRLGVTGASGGGYLTNWIVGHTDRFKAAVTVSSISNWYSFYGCSDLGPAGTLPFWDLGLGKDPWDDEELWLKPSPIRYVKNVKTPLMIVHGENDLRCPMEQAEQLFIALKKLKKTVEFLRFPDEAHGIGSNKPSHSKDYFQHSLRWFNTYLLAETQEPPK